MLSGLQGSLRLLPTALSTLGATGTARYAVARLGGRVRERGTGTLHPRWSRVPVQYRRGTSDLHVFRQIFLEREYRCLDGVSSGDVRLIVDCGANVGYSSAYLLSRFPQARLLAVEPDRGNLAVLERNLAPFADRVQLVEGAVWSRSTQLTFAAEVAGAGDEWARQVRPCLPGEPGVVQAYGIEELLARTGFDRISILKIDVEGAERELFATRPAWLDRVDHLVIELHGDVCRQAFLDAIDGIDCELSECGELTVFHRRPGSPVAGAAGA